MCWIAVDSALSLVLLKLLSESPPRPLFASLWRKVDYARTLTLGSHVCGPFIISIPFAVLVAEGAADGGCPLGMSETPPPTRVLAHNLYRNALAELQVDASAATDTLQGLLPLFQLTRTLHLSAWSTVP